MMKPIKIEQWEFKLNTQTGILRVAGQVGNEAILSTKVVRENYPFVETVDGGYYQLEGPSRDEMIKTGRIHPRRVHI